MIPKVKFIAVITADQTVGFDGSSVILDDAANTILAALQVDPEWTNALALNVVVIKK